ncbi:MAG: hypothetical protein A2896_02930 [Candidatus Nealsonbacteria bacterium RIFCSPLOWO2_01_FULL_43_32]|uniref:Uncharacterized protein n=1 Tax=Candidatus Nealsonbacteria bacterium RIFCSPLOWO2_01_FULL_43_32 TaxID=1801672 RepID=A0A1G2EFB1_9BACT|nr:MAG: hypothetical protein A2896_02930 [Candidatus Nealsonbacteria bacterium RIFCSPLOWO2_01_FULL_43_32]
METTVGIERERFIVRLSDGMIVPAIKDLLPTVQVVAQKRGMLPELFGYELFAGQIEDRTPPCRSLEDLKNALIINDQILGEASFRDGLSFNFTEFAEESQITELVVNPFDRRHQKIWESISSERRLAASRVAAIHVHVAVVDTNIAIKLLGLCNDNMIEYLSKIGDHSDGKRLLAYRTMSQSKGTPPKFSTGDDLLEYIREHGGERDVWDLVRYKSKTRTVEFRMFGTTEDVNEIIRYAEACLALYRISLK